MSPTMTPDLAQWLLAQRPTDGTGKKTNLLDILCNATLVDDGVRLSFMVQPIDYTPRSVGVEIARRLANAGYETFAINQGIVVCLPQNARKVRGLLDEYERNQDEMALGRALSYPNPMNTDGEREPPYMMMDWVVRGPNGETAQVMGNICTGPENVKKGLAMAAQMARSLGPRGISVEFMFVAQYDPELLRHRHLFAVAGSIEPAVAVE